MKFPFCDHEIPPVGQTVIKGEGDKILIQVGRVMLRGALNAQQSICWHLERQQAVDFANLILYIAGESDQCPTIEGLITPL